MRRQTHDRSMNAMRQKAARESVADVLAEWRDEAGPLTDEDEAWVQEAPDASAAGLLTGLLDLGDEGAAAFARGLRGPRRRLFVEGLGTTSRPVPQEVALALLEPVNASTPVDERRAVWIAAYRTAPASAAAALADAIARMDPTVRAEARDVLDVVRHRAVR